MSPSKTPRITYILCDILTFSREVFDFLVQKAPAGAHPGAPSLESTCFVYLGHKNKDSVFIKYRRCIFAGEKAPAGAHLDTPSLESTCFVYLRHKNQDSLFSKNIISYSDKIKSFCHDPTSDFPTRFSDGNMKNSIPVNLFRVLSDFFLYYLGVIYKTRWVLILI